MRQTTIWDFLPQESSFEAKQTNQPKEYYEI